MSLPGNLNNIVTNVYDLLLINEIKYSYSQAHNLPIRWVGKLILHCITTISKHFQTHFS